MNSCKGFAPLAFSRLLTFKISLCDFHSEDFNSLDWKNFGTCWFDTETKLFLLSTIYRGEQRDISKVPTNPYAVFKQDCVSQRFTALHPHWKAVKSSLDKHNETSLKYEGHFTQDN